MNKIKSALGEVLHSFDSDVSDIHMMDVLDCAVSQGLIPPGKYKEEDVRKILESLGYVVEKNGMIYF